MSTAAKPQFTVDEFLAWAEGREGHWELHEGELVAMAPERVAHLETKAEAFIALRSAIERASAPCHAVPDGATVRIAARTAFEPDALVDCGTRQAGGRNRNSRAGDRGRGSIGGNGGAGSRVKLAGYFSLPSLAHYVILDPDNRMATHHRRGEGDVIETRILKDGQLRLDPPGLEIPVQDLFAPV